MKLPSFRDYDAPARKLPYGWDFFFEGKRLRPTFKTKTEKVDYKKAFLERWTANRDALASFDPAKWQRFLELERRAGGMDSLETAVVMATRAGANSGVRFSVMMRQRVEDLVRAGGVNRKRVDLLCGRFVAALGDRVLSDYQPYEIQAWVDELAASPEHGYYSTRNHLKAVSAAFNLAIARRELITSPAAHIKLPSRRGEKRTVLWSPEQLQCFLRYLWRREPARASVYALIFFTGLRVSMVAPNPEKRAKSEFLRPDMIDLKNRTIVIPEGIMKSEQALVIDEGLAPANLWPWLKHLKKARIPEPSQTFNYRRTQLCQTLGMEWSDNVHRRSCASYYAALHGKDMAANLLGNTGEMIARHYKVASFRKDAASYFEILPPG